MITKEQARAELDAIRYVPAKYKHVTSGRRIRLIVMHDMEAPENRDTTAENVARYFQDPERPSSAHYNCDRDSTVRSVLDKDVAYHAPGASHDGIGIEQAGFARQTREEWLDADSRLVMAQSSRIAALCCVAHDLPPVWLTDSQLRNGSEGIVHHLQVSRVYKRSSHWDCGYYFPQDHFIGLVKGHLNPVPRRGFTVNVVYARAGIPGNADLMSAVEAHRNGLADSVLVHDTSLARRLLATDRVIAIGGPSVEDVFGPEARIVGVRKRGDQGQHVAVVGTGSTDTHDLAVRLARNNWQV